MGTDLFNSIEPYREVAPRGSVDFLLRLASRVQGDFYATTKAFHNALQGKEQVFTDAMLGHYIEVNHVNADRLRAAGDLALIRARVESTG